MITHYRAATLYHVHKPCCITACHAIILYSLPLSGCLSWGLAGSWLGLQQVPRWFFTLVLPDGKVETWSLS